MADIELNVSVDTDQFKAMLDAFVQNTLPGAVQEIVRSEAMRVLEEFLSNAALRR